MIAPGDYPRTVVLTDGAHLALRPATAADAPALAAFRARLGASERDRLGDPAAGGDGTLWILALSGATVAAVLGLVRQDGAAEGEVRLALDPDFARRRLGTWMLLDAVHLAAALGLERLAAAVPGDALAEHDALRRLDFVEEGPRVGRRVRLVKRLYVGWTDF